MVANGTDLLESPSEPLGFKHVERFRASSLAHCCEQRTEKAKVPALSSNETSPASLARDEWYSAVVQASRVRSAVAHAVGVRVPAAPLRRCALRRRCTPLVPSSRSLLRPGRRGSRGARMSCPVSGGMRSRVLRCQWTVGLVGLMSSKLS